MGTPRQCHLPRPGVRDGSFGSGAGGSAGLGSLGAGGTLLLLTGIGWGSICLGNPLKNQAPDRFQTWGEIDRGGLRAHSPLSPSSQPLLLFIQLFDFFHPVLAVTTRSP